MFTAAAMAYGGDTDCVKGRPMVLDVRGHRGALAVSAGVFLGSIGAAAVANAAPDATSAQSGPDAAITVRASRVSPAAKTRPVTTSGPARAAARTAAQPTRRTDIVLARPVGLSGVRSRDALTAVTPAATLTRAASAPVGQAVSPLGTPEQIAAESTATRTAHTLPVLAMKGLLTLAWRITGATNYSHVGGPDDANLAALRDAVDEWAMGSVFQSMILDSNDPRIVMQVAPPHQWYGKRVSGSRLLYDNPDTIYRFVGVNAASEYVITGRLPGQAAEGVAAQASFSVLTGLTGRTAAVLDADQLDVDPDGSFVLTVSGEPAQPGQKNHLQITSDTTLIAIRDTLPDWTIQDPMGLTIHRTAGPRNSLFGQFGGFAIPVVGPLVAQSPILTTLVSLVPPLPGIPPIVRGSITALLMLRGISEERKYIKVATTDPLTGNRKEPNIFTDPTSNASFLSTQLQSAGYFQLSDDQALVLTVRPNNAAYFVAPVTNDWTVTGNYWGEQTSLNNAQAKINPDGSYTLVVSPAEPQLGDGTSVWNWVSTGGLNQGTMAIRFQGIDPDNPVAPKVSSQVVSLSELSTVLPVGTPAITPDERAAQIASRVEGFDLRFAPYPQSAA